MIRQAVLITIAVVVLSLSVLDLPVQAQDTPSTQELVDLRASAEAGDADAQTSLGWKYANGEGVQQDYAEAIVWFRLAAEQGDADAQNSLGVMYDNGEGVPQDDAEAVAWYRLAAEQGYASAQNSLGSCTPPVWAYRRTPRKPPGGTAWPPSRASTSPSSTSG